MTMPETKVLSAPARPPWWSNTPSIRLSPISIQPPAVVMTPPWARNPAASLCRTLPGSSDRDRTRRAWPCHAGGGPIGAGRLHVHARHVSHGLGLSLTAQRGEQEACAARDEAATECESHCLKPLSKMTAASGGKRKCQLRRRGGVGSGPGFRPGGTRVRGPRVDHGSGVRQRDRRCLDRRCGRQTAGATEFTKAGGGRRVAMVSSRRRRHLAGPSWPSPAWSACRSQRWPGRSRTSGPKDGGA